MSITALPWDVIVVGAGPAGLGAAVGAAQKGARVLVVDREDYAGGVLPQCVHDGFGLHIHHHALTGPEYAGEWERRAREAGAHFALGTIVLGIHEANGVPGSQSAATHARASRFCAEMVGPAVGGHCWAAAQSVVVATGCRERTAGQLGLPGTRPSGVMTAGCAQYLMNVRNQLPGDKVVILGSGDIGLIMARRLTLEGAQVRMVLGQEATGLLRNHVRCIQDFDIPFRSGWGIASVHGTGRLKGVTMAPIGPDGQLDASRGQYIRCNLLLLACGLIPEQEVLGSWCAGGSLPKGLFVCGNARRPHDLADSVTQEGLQAGLEAASAALGVSVSDGAARIDEAEDAACLSWSLPAETRRILAAKVREPRGRLFELDGSAEGEVLVPCTVCPSSCIGKVSPDGSISGLACEKGRRFVHQELRCPLRLFTGTVKVEGAVGHPLVPVRTSCDVPRESLAAVAAACRRLVARAPIRSGQVLAVGIGGTDADLVACASRTTGAGDGGC